MTTLIPKYDLKNGGSSPSGAVNRPINQKLGETVSVKDFGAVGDGVTNDYAAIQAAINSGAKYIIFPTGSYYTDTCINMTGLLDVALIGYGANESCQINGSTGSGIIDMSGSARCLLKNLMIQNTPSGGVGSGTSTYGIMLASTNAQNCLYNTFEEIYVQMYNTSAPSAYGAVGIIIAGSEENNFIACRVFAQTPYIVSTAYNIVSSNYTSVYQNANIQVSHSSGMNTWSGENSAVTFDNAYSNFYLYGVNNIDFGNMYFGNINIGTPLNTIPGCITYLGGTTEGCVGTFKSEGTNTLLNIAAVGPQLYGWDLRYQPTLGSGGGENGAVVNINSGSSVFTGFIYDFHLDINYTIPTGATNKLFSYTGATDGTTTRRFANITVITNQFAGAVGNPLFPNIFCGTTENMVLDFIDANYTLNNNCHTKTFRGTTYLGAGNASPSIVGQIQLPAINSGTSARSISLIASGNLTSINETGGGTETLVTTVPFKVSRSAGSANDGAITTTAASSPDSWLSSTSASAFSTDPSTALYTGVLMNLVYQSTSREINIDIGPVGTGSSLSGVLAFINDLTFQMETSGRAQDLIYVS